MNKNGQSLIEYALITVLVVMGVVVMGPYVLRSINGHFELWNEGIHDSFSEVTVQAPAFTLVTNCVCTDSCSLGTPATATAPATPNTCTQDSLYCPPGQYMITTTCVPQGCNNAPTIMGSGASTISCHAAPSS